MTYLLNLIRRKGLIETTFHGCCHFMGIFLSKIKVLWLYLRGYDIDFSVRLRGRNVIFQDTKKSIQIDRNCEIGFGTIIRSGFGGKVIIKQGVGIYDYTVVDIQEKLEIGENTLIAPFCYITDYDHVVKDKNRPIIDQGYISKPIVIGKNVWLGAKVVVLKGVRIGDNTIIGAGSVVTGDIPANSVAVGVPARVIKKIVNC